MEKTGMIGGLIFRLLGMPILALSCAALAAGQNSKTDASRQSLATHPQIAGIRVGPHVTVSGPSSDYPSADGYCEMDILADGHSTVFAPGILPDQLSYLFFVTAAPFVNTVTDSTTNFRGQASGLVVLSSSGPANGQWALDFAPDYGKYSNAKDGTSNASRTNLCATRGEVFRTPILHDVCPTFTGGVGNATFDLTYVGAGSVLIDPTNLGPRELLAVYNGNNNCIGHDGNPKNAEDEMSGYYATTGVGTSDNYGKSWPIYKTNYQQYPGETPAPPNAPEGASGADVCSSSLDQTCSPATYPAGIYFGRYPALTPSLTVEEAVASYSSTGLKHTIGSQEPSAFIDDVHASVTPDIYLYTVQISACASTYCPLSTPGNEGTISVARAKLNGGTGPLNFTRWYGPSVSYDSYVKGTAGASFDLQTGLYLNTPFTNAGTGYNGGGPAHGGLDSPIFPMDNNRSARSYTTCQAGGTGGDNDQRQEMGSISYVPAARQYLLTFLCSSPSDPSQPMPSQFDATQKGAGIFYSTLDADLYDLSRQDKWSPPQEVTGSWEPFIPNRRICSNDHKLCGSDTDCAPIVDSKGNTVENVCALPSASDCLTPAIQQASKDPNDSADKGCDLDRNKGWYPSFMSTQSNPDPTHPTNPGYLSTSADGYIFSMEGCLGPSCRYPRVYNSRQFWIDACSFSLSAASQSFSSLGGTGSFDVTSGTGCAWTANSNNPDWIAVTGGAPGSGNGTVSFSVAQNTGAARSGTITAGGQTFTVNQAANLPQAVSVSPGAATGTYGSYTFTFSDPAGWQKINVANILINNFVDGRNACYVAVAPSGAGAPGSGSVYLVDDAGDAGGPYQGIVLPGSGTAQNSQCSISGTGSSIAGSGNTLTVTLAITFKAAFAGNRIMYLAARESGGASSGWQALGTCGIPGSTPTGPAVGGVTPARSSGTGGGTFTFTFTDGVPSGPGWLDLGIMDVLINDSLNGNKACYLAYIRTSNTLYLVNDAGNGLLPGLTLNGAGGASSGLANSQCTVTGAGSSASGSGNTLTLTLNMSFPSAFAGNRLIYMAARSLGDVLNSGWQAMGSRTVQ